MRQGSWISGQLKERLALDKDIQEKGGDLSLRNVNLVDSLFFAVAVECLLGNARRKIEVLGLFKDLNHNQALFSECSRAYFKVRKYTRLEKDMSPSAQSLLA
jgi:hypothetical protein